MNNEILLFGMTLLNCPHRSKMTLIPSTTLVARPLLMSPLLLLLLSLPLQMLSLPLQLHMLLQLRSVVDLRRYFSITSLYRQKHRIGISYLDIATRISTTATNASTTKKRGRPNKVFLYNFLLFIDKNLG